MFNFFNKSDTDVKRDVVNELLWDASIDASHVKVSANDGIVTLRGSVPHFIEKVAAEHAAQRVGGVKGVADELEVKASTEKTDEEIARAAVNAISWNYKLPEGIQVAVDDGWVTLSGEVEWDYQRASAQDTVSQLIGVTGVLNNISIKTKVLPSDIKNLIEAALKRSAESEGRKITVAVDGDKVTLSGNVQSFSEIEDARKAAWMAPGVRRVDNNLRLTQ